MNYTLVDLGLPHEKTMAAAFINTNIEENYLVKGGWVAVLRHLSNLQCSFIGKVRSYSTKHAKLLGITPISSQNITIRLVKPHGRKLYEFRDSKHDLLLARVRRFPNRWIKELSVDVDAVLSISTEFLKEKGFGLSAQLIEKAVKKRDIYGDSARGNIPGFKVNSIR